MIGEGVGIFTTCTKFFTSIASASAGFFPFGGRGGERFPERILFRGWGKEFNSHNLNLDTRHNLIAWNKYFNLSHSHFALLLKLYLGGNQTHLNAIA